MIFARRIDALATRAVAGYLAGRWRRVSGRRGPSRSASPWQRPHIYFTGLTGRPWWDAADFPWTRRVEEHTDVLTRELRGLLREGFLQPPPIEAIPVRERDLDQRLIRSGSWHLYRLYYNGLELTANSERCPETARLFKSIPDQWGTVGFGVLGPGTHVEPHCGPSNAKLRCHLGLQVPERCGIRVERETRTWADGRCLVFDDSFEHEVWNEGHQPRYIFLLDVHHPELTAREKRWIEGVSRRLVTMAPRSMQKALRHEPHRSRPAAPSLADFDD